MAAATGQVLFFDAKFLPNVSLLLSLAPAKLSYSAPGNESINNIPVCMVTKSGSSSSIRPGDIICSINETPTINTHHHWKGGTQPNNVALQLLSEQQDQPKTIRFMRLKDPNVLALNTVIRFGSEEVLKQIFDDKKSTPMWNAPWDKVGNDFVGFGGGERNGSTMGGRNAYGGMAGTSNGSISDVGNGTFGLHGNSKDDPFSKKVGKMSSPSTPHSPVPEKEPYARALFFDVTFPLDRTSVGLSLDPAQVQYNRALTDEHRLFNCAKVLESSVSAQVRPGDLVVKLNGQPLVNPNYVASTAAGTSPPSFGPNTHLHHTSFRSTSFTHDTPPLHVPMTEKHAYLQNLAHMIANAPKPKTITFLRATLARPSVHFDTLPMLLTKHDEDVLFTNMPSSDNMPVQPSSTQQQSLQSNGTTQPSSSPSLLSSSSDLHQFNPSNTTTSRPFIPSMRFEGGRVGYTFKKGKEGLGYYVDSNQQQTPSSSARMKRSILSSPTLKPVQPLPYSSNKTITQPSPASEGTAGAIRGFQKDILKAGDPTKRPMPGKPVTIHCTGYGKNGDLRQKFWSTRDIGQKPVTFPIGIGEVIRVWDEGVISMAVGEVARITCGSEYGYGAEGFPLWGIKPYSALQFEIELLDASSSNGSADGSIGRNVSGARNGSAGGGDGSSSAPFFGGARNGAASGTKGGAGALNGSAGAAGVGSGGGGTIFDNSTFSSARVFSVSHRVPGPMGLQMMPITISYPSDTSAGTMPSVVIACLITGSTKISNIQAGDVIINLNGGSPLLAQGSNGDGHVISVATLLSKTRPATLKLFRCAKISAGTPEVQLTSEERAIFFS